MLVVASCTYLLHVMYTNSLETTLNQPHDLLFKAISLTDQDNLVQMWDKPGKKIILRLPTAKYFLF